MGTTGYQKYIPVTIATDVSEETVAAIAENQDELEGISVAEDTIRKYKDGPYYSQILGYTGKISTDELTALNSKEGMDGVKSAPDVKEYERRMSSARLASKRSWKNICREQRAMRQSLLTGWVER